MQKKLLSASALAASFLALHSGGANAALLYANDFDSAATVGTGITATGISSGVLEVANAGFGDWSGNYLANRSTGNPATMSSITFSGLASHTSVDINFLVGFLESWDSRNGSVDPDNLDIYVDGILVASLTSNNASGTIEDYDGGTELFDGVELNANFGWTDTLVDMSTSGALNLAHTASTLTLGFQASGAGWQGGSDEAWGIDDIEITYDATASVPEPATLALLGLGLAGVGLSRGRKNR